MKKIILVAGAALLLHPSLHAQTKMSWYIIGGKMSVIKPDFQKCNTFLSFDLLPEITWFVYDELSICAYALLCFNTGKRFTTISYGVGKLERYYFKEKTLTNVKKICRFVEGNGELFGSYTKISGASSIYTKGLGVGFCPGQVYFLNENTALQALAEYNLTVGFGNSTAHNELNPGIGFQIHLPNSKLKAVNTEIK